MYNPMDLSGKRVLITGAGSGIGRETAIVLSKLGAQAVLLDIKEQGMNDTLSLLENRENHQAYSIDLSKIEEIEPLVRNIIRTGAFQGDISVYELSGSDRPVRPDHIRWRRKREALRRLQAWKGPVYPRDILLRVYRHTRREEEKGSLY